MNIMGEETPGEAKERAVAEAIRRIFAELKENSKQPRNELDGWDHKREYRRLTVLASDALRLATKPHKFFDEYRQVNAERDEHLMKGGK